jgi:hypothetical protein
MRSAYSAEMSSGTDEEKSASITRLRTGASTQSANGTTMLAPRA